jgi:hypothetical protein
LHKMIFLQVCAFIFRLPIFFAAKLGPTKRFKHCLNQLLGNPSGCALHKALSTIGKVNLKHMG